MEGLYIHIPFCHSKCAYCDFFSTPKVGRINDVLAAVCEEWKIRKDELSGNPTTIYIGGGTPSLLSCNQVTKLVEALPVSSAVEEFTMEANPEDVTVEKVRLWKELGINRVSMGVQSFNDAELSFVRRRHSSEDAKRAYAFLMENGISNISLDLIYGLPLQTIQTWKESLGQLFSLRPKHFSAYMLSYEKGTLLNAMLISGKHKETAEDILELMYDELCGTAREYGYDHYEISNYSLPGFRSVHNSNYWKFSSYLGLGPSAHSFTNGLRKVNPSDMMLYSRMIRNGLPAYEIEPESELDSLNDRIMVALRTSEGLDMSVLAEEQQDGLKKRMKCLPPGYIMQEDNRIYIPENRYLVSDAIIRTLLAE